MCPCDTLQKNQNRGIKQDMIEYTVINVKDLVN